jgi:hydroxymethylbilane synthase
MTGARAVRLATRGSPLAMLQAQRVAGLLKQADEAILCETVVVATTGDVRPDLSIEQISGQGAFVKEVSAAVLDGRAEVAVHSAKDLMPVEQQGLVLAAVPERADPRDALLGAPLERLPPGATVATGSVRRRAQLSWLRPDLTFCPMRGNMARRIERAEHVGAGVVALAALERLSLTDRVADVLDTRVVLPQVGQGAIALECRADDTETLDLLALVDDADAHAAVDAERAFLASLGSGCSLPCGALASWDPTDPQDRTRLVLDAVMSSRDGHVLLRHSACGSEPEELGRQVAREMIEDAGAGTLGDWEARLPVPSSAEDPVATGRRTAPR